MNLILAQVLCRAIAEARQAVSSAPPQASEHSDSAEGQVEWSGAIPPAAGECGLPTRVGAHLTD
eukprot:2203136-Heterocapsa_arctica.AAC.1